MHLQWSASWACSILTTVLLLLQSVPVFLIEDSAMKNSEPVIKLTSGKAKSFPVTKPTKDLPLIMWWTDRLFMHGSVAELQCPRATCYTAKDRQYLNDPRTRGFIFYGTDLEPDDLPIPREAHHEWALFHEESPMNNYMLSHGAMLKLFNHTATFRRESDYPITSNHLPSLGYLTDRKPVAINKKNSLRKDGLAPILYVQSHCAVASDRDRYVEELSKHIGVDSIGKCVQNKDIPAHLSDPSESMEAANFLDLISQYKFHLAFENALCKDYMTEKLFRPLHVGSVPIYRGSSAARDWMPDERSIIMADDFQSAEELAKFIHHLDTDDTAYEEYLLFKKPGEVTNSFLRQHLQSREWGINEPGKMDMLFGFECHVCERLSQRYKREQEHEEDPAVPLLPPRWAETSHLSCPQPYPSVGDTGDLPHNDRWIQQSWIDDYWSGMDKALAIQEMLAAGEKHSSKFDEYWEKVVRRQQH